MTGLRLIDADNRLRAAYDAPVGGALLSANWQLGYPVYERLPITLASTPGTYQVYIGLYEPETRDRLPVAAPDYRPLLGEIRVG